MGGMRFSAGIRFDGEAVAIAAFDSDLVPSAATDCSQNQLAVAALTSWPRGRDAQTPHVEARPDADRRDGGDRAGRLRYPP